MQEYTIKKYTKEDFEDWNAFLAASKNGTFLFNREFMDYHNDRFTDFSFMVFRKNKLIGLFPANVSGNEVYSHQGLTYGGVILNHEVKLVQVIQLFKAILSFLHENNIKKLYLKLIPPIYHKAPAHELEYALFLCDAKLTRRDTMSVYDPVTVSSFSNSRKEGIKRGIKNKLEIKEETDFTLFWKEILIPNLQKKYNSTPVHTIEEITLLQKRFPENIRHFNVYHENKIVAGTTVFVSDLVAHSQYISSKDDKNQLGSLDYLYNYLITDIFKNKKYFDFGTSNECNGRNLNEGLVFWKEGFGARTFVHDFYEVETFNFNKLENVLI